MFGHKFSLSYKVSFFRRLSSLLSAGIPFVHSLSLMKEREVVLWKNKHIQAILSVVLRGQSISSGFDLKPRILDVYLINVVRNAELSGTLTKSFLLISKELSSRLENRRRVVGMLIYPFVVVLCAIFLAVFLYGFVFPQILPLIVSSGSELPIYTRLLLVSFNFFAQYGLLFIISCTIVVALGIYSYKRFTSIKNYIQVFSLKIPFIRKIIYVNKNIIFSRSLSLFLETGNTLVEALSHLYEHETHHVFKETYKNLTHQVRYGKRFSSALLEKTFSAELIQLVCVGEESGTLSSSLQQSANIHEEELHNLQKTIFLLIEPALMIVLGFAVGFVALSLIVPMYSLTKI